MTTPSPGRAKSAQLLGSDNGGVPRMYNNRSQPFTDPTPSTNQAIASQQAVADSVLPMPA